MKQNLTNTKGHKTVHRLVKYVWNSNVSKKKPHSLKLLSSNIIELCQNMCTPICVFPLRCSRRNNV